MPVQQSNTSNNRIRIRKETSRINIIEYLSHLKLEIARTVTFY